MTHLTPPPFALAYALRWGVLTTARPIPWASDETLPSGKIMSALHISPCRLSGWYPHFCLPVWDDEKNDYPEITDPVEIDRATKGFRDHGRPAPHAPGDVAWVRETYRARYDEPNHGASLVVEYRADGAIRVISAFADSTADKWRSPVTMPRALSRLTVRCTGIDAVKVAEMTRQQVESIGFKTRPRSKEWRRRSQGKTGFADWWDHLYPSHPHADAWAWIATWERIEETKCPPQSAEQQELIREDHRINRWLRSKP